jgi:RNA polymerase sigma-70 factor (ECF subfamily)
MDNSPNSQENVVRLITRHQREIYLYALGRLHSPEGAEEVLQETNVVLWRKLDQYQPGTKFLAWACTVAEYEVRKYLERTRRALPTFSQAMRDDVVEELLVAVEESSHTQQALAACLEKLAPGDRQLLDQRYSAGASVKSVAAATGRSIDAVYRAMRRIHSALFTCISTKLASEG